MRGIIFIAVYLTAVAAVLSKQQKIAGGTVTSISQYPAVASLLYSWDLSNFLHACSGVIVNTRSILTAAYCPHGDPNSRWRICVGSNSANSGGVVYLVSWFIIHPHYNSRTHDSDIAIMRTSSTITYVTNAVRPGVIAGANYNLNDNHVVWAAGWGSATMGGPASEQLRHVQFWTINQNTCAQRYASVGSTITANMLCSGWIDIVSRNECQGDPGGPLYHNNVIIGIYSWGQSCDSDIFYNVNVRVSRFSSWIQAFA